jgi:hypothetical protein
LGRIAALQAEGRATSPSLGSRLALRPKEPRRGRD